MTWSTLNCHRGSRGRVGGGREGEGERGRVGRKERDRERGREKEGGKERGREREREVRGRWRDKLAQLVCKNQN